jgi:putative ABC transport system permease protein
VRIGDERLQVIGVARDSKYGGLDADPIPHLCTLLRQVTAVQQFNLLVRTSVPPGTVREAVLDEIRRLDPNLPPPQTMTIEQFIETAVAVAGGSLDTVPVFGLLALALAMTGIYGVMSYSVSRRTQEFGIRMALGAPRRQIVGLVLRRGLTITVAGLIVGLAASVAVGRLLEAYLFGVSALDPLTYAAVTLVLLITALAACYFPAHVAGRVGPATALRHQ